MYLDVSRLVYRINFCPAVVANAIVPNRAMDHTLEYCGHQS